MPDKRVTIRDLARKSGFSTFTVSAALRDSPRVAASTREKIKEIAREAGYVPSAVLSSLGAARYREEGKRTLIASVYLVPDDPFWMRQTHNQAGPLEAVAQEEGLALRSEWVHSVEALQCQLQHWQRIGIEGILLNQWVSAKSLADLSIDFGAFSWLAMCDVDPGTNSPLHSVRPDLQQAIIMAWAKAHEQGHQRIGAIFPQHTDTTRFADDVERWAGVHGAQRYFGQLEPIPPLFIPAEIIDHDHEVATREYVEPWLAKHRPDAVAGFNGIVYHFLKRADHLPPEKLSFIHLDFCEERNQIQRITVAGFRATDKERMRTALHHLTRMVVQRERGLPSTPLRTLVPFTWMDGESLPDRRPGRT